MNRVYATHKSSNTSKNNFKIVCSTVTHEIKLELNKSKYPKWANFFNKWNNHHCCIRNRPLGNRYVGFSELFLPSIQCCLASLAGERFGSCNNTTCILIDLKQIWIYNKGQKWLMFHCFPTFFSRCDCFEKLCFNFLNKYTNIFIGANMRITVQ